MDLTEEIQNFKNNIDPDLAHKDIESFVNSVALTPSERKLAMYYIKQKKENA